MVGIGKTVECTESNVDCTLILFVNVYVNFAVAAKFESLILDLL